MSLTHRQWMALLGQPLGSEGRFAGRVTPPGRRPGDIVLAGEGALDTDTAVKRITEMLNARKGPPPPLPKDPPPGVSYVHIDDFLRKQGSIVALTKLGMIMPQQQQPQKSGGGGIGGMAKSMLSGGLIGTGGLLSGGMGIPGTGGINPMMGKKPGGGQRMDPTGMQGFPNPASTGITAWRAGQNRMG